MSRGRNLQEMEVGTTQSKSAVNASAKAADQMQTMAGVGYEDLGGPDPSNYRPDDDSAKLKDAGAGLKKVSLVAARKVAEEYDEVEEEDLNLVKPMNTPRLCQRKHASRNSSMVGRTDCGRTRTERRTDDEFVT
jgi:hypothetical protein